MADRDGRIRALEAENEELRRLGAKRPRLDEPVGAGKRDSGVGDVESDVMTVRILSDSSDDGDTDSGDETDYTSGS